MTGTKRLMNQWMASVDMLQVANAEAPAPVER